MEGKLMINTNLNPRGYHINEVNRICNRDQQTFYIDNNVYPIDLYTSYDKHDRKIIVMVFEKEKTKELYQKWRNYDTEIKKD
jgi:hypothetical protein